MEISDDELAKLAQFILDRLQRELQTIGEQGPLLDANEAASFLRCSKASVERMTRSGELRSLKIGNLRRYRKSDLLSIRKEGE